MCGPENAYIISLHLLVTQQHMHRLREDHVKRNMNFILGAKDVSLQRYQLLKGFCFKVKRNKQQQEKESKSRFSVKISKMSYSVRQLPSDINPKMCGITHRV